MSLLPASPDWEAEPKQWVAHGEEGEGKHSCEGRPEPRADSWEGRLKEVLGGVANPGNLRQVK